MDMKYQDVTINGRTITIPAYYERVDSMPGDPEGSVAYAAQTDNVMCFALIFPVDESRALPREQSELIGGIRQFLSEKQGLIRAEASEERAYSIVKTLKEHGGVQYGLSYQRFYPEFVLDVQAFFEEVGMTGQRDSVVYDLCRREGLVGNADDPFAGWARDPYDESVTEGALMNLSEDEQFDEYFPGFPLTMCREFVRGLEEGDFSILLTAF